jgi:hypothetical protein
MEDDGVDCVGWEGKMMVLVFLRVLSPQIQMIAPSLG